MEILVKSNTAKRPSNLYIIMFSLFNQDFQYGLLGRIDCTPSSFR